MITDTLDGSLITQQKFQEQARVWASVVVTKMRSNASKFKHGKERKRAHSVKKYNKKTGNMENKTVYEDILKKSVKYKLRTYGDFSRISFEFAKHGIYRMYGVGSGQPSASGKKQAKVVRVKRTMSDWINQPIEQDFEKLANIASEYFGDKVLANVYGVNIKK